MDREVVKKRLHPGLQQLKIISIISGKRKKHTHEYDVSFRIKDHPECGVITRPHSHTTPEGKSYYIPRTPIGCEPEVFVWDWYSQFSGTILIDYTHILDGVPQTKVFV